MTFFPVRMHTDSSKADNETHRLCVIRWKAKKDESGKVVPARSAMCVSIPRISILAEPSILSVSLQAAFEEMQDKVVRELIEEAFSKGDQQPVISPESVTVEAVAAWYTRQAANGRLSGESLKHWFDASLSDKLSLALGEAMKLPDEPTDEQMKQLTAVLDQYKTGIVNLASPRASLPVNVATQLKKAVELADDDEVKPKLISKLDAFLNPTTFELGVNL